MEYGVQVNNKFAFVSDDEAEDPSDLIRKAEQERVVKTPAQKKAEKEAARKAKIQAEKDRQAAVAASIASKENRPAGRGGRGRGRGAGPRPPRAEGDRPDRPPRAEGERSEFRGRGRGRGGARPFGRGGASNAPAEGEEAKEVVVDENGLPVERPPRRSPRGGFAGRGRGGFRGERQFDRHSGSDRPQGDKKEGYGKGNWGTKEDDVVVAETEENKVASSDEAEAVPVAPREKTAEELELEAIEAEIAKQKTLAEYRATLQKDEQSFNIRKAGEGNDDNFGKLVPMAKKLNIADEREEVIVVRSEPKKKQLNIDIRFTETNRGGSDRGDRRGGARGGGRGGRGRGGAGARAPRQQNTAFNSADSEAFPALG